MVGKDELAFVEEILKVYEKYNLSLGHEDHHGAFIIEPYDEVNVEWLRAALPYPNNEQ